MIRRLWVSTPMLRLGCAPLDAYAWAVLKVKAGLEWLARQQAALR